MGLSALGFGVSLIRVLSRAKPAIKELPELNVFTLQQPGFWVRVLLLLIGLVLTFLLGMFISPGLSMMLVCGLLGLGVTLSWRHALTWKVTAVGFVVGLISALGTTFLGTGDLL